MLDSQVQLGREPASRASQSVIFGLGEHAARWFLLQVTLLASPGRMLAEEAGCDGPDRIQRMLNRIEWDVEEVLDDVRAGVVENLGEPEAVLIVHDIGFLRKGTWSAGVQRQYSGTVGRTTARWACSSAMQRLVAGR